jgi:tRNA A37 threonylcarbamoyladenosine biosynthesis protein TsaE
VEWAEKAEDDIPEEHLSVYLAYVDDKSRELGFLAEGERYQKLLDELSVHIKS